MRFRIGIITLLLFFPIFKSLAQQGIQFRNLSYNEALAASAKENKPVFLHAYASWCHLCEYMRDSVYTNPSVGEFFNARFINIRIDMEKEGKELNRKFKAANFPTLIVLDSSGNTIHRIAGKKNAQDFLQFGIDAFTPERRLSTYEQRFKSGQITPMQAYVYFGMLRRAGLDNQAAINFYFDKIPDTDFVLQPYWRILYEQFSDVERPLMDRFVRMREPLIAVYTADSVDNRILTSYNNSLMQKVQKLDSLGYQEQLRKLKSKNDPLYDKICAYAEISRMKLLSNWQEYIRLAPAFVDQYCKTDYRRLNDISQTFYERCNDQEQLKQAVKWSEKAVQLMDNYRNNHTLAALYYKTGKKDAAKNAAEHAITMAKGEMENRQTTLLLEKISEMP